MLTLTEIRRLDLRDPSEVQLNGARRTAAFLAALLFVAADTTTAKDRDASAARPSACQEIGLGVLVSPAAPSKGAPMRVLITAEKPLDGELSLIAPDGVTAIKSAERLGGPPYFWFAEVATPAEGKWQAKLTRNGASADCTAITREIACSEPRRGPAGRGEGQCLANSGALESRDGEPLFGVDRKAFRRAS